MLAQDNLGHIWKWHNFWTTVSQDMKLSGYQHLWALNTANESLLGWSTKFFFYLSSKLTKIELAYNCIKATLLTTFLKYLNFRMTGSQDMKLSGYQHLWALNTANERLLWCSSKFFFFLSSKLNRNCNWHIIALKQHC